MTAMLPLDDPGWQELHHAYGTAENIPPLLKTLSSSTGPRADQFDEPWFTLWSSLCHQGDVYGASYHAVPHIIQIASEATGPIDWSFFALPTSIEIARISRRGPELTRAQAAEYHGAIGRLVDIVNSHRNESWDRSMLRSAIAAQAIAKGHCDIAEALLNLDDEWIAKINEDNAD